MNRRARSTMGALLALGVLAAFVAPVQAGTASETAAGTIETFAGGGGAGVATNVAHANLGTALHDGALYIVDGTWNVVRRLDLATGMETVVAGNGVATNGVTRYDGDGIPATSAQLQAPTDVALDDDGNLYIADFGAARVRKVDTNGIITTVAGNGVVGSAGDGLPATMVPLGCPMSVDVDDAGNLYIAEWSHRVRKVDAGGIITTVAGRGTSTNAGVLVCGFVSAGGGYSGDGGPGALAELRGPASVAVAPDGDLYIADFYNNRIRRVDGAGVITTAVGTGAGGFSGDGGPATAAQVQNPNGLAFDEAGNLYFADSGNHRIRRVEAAGDRTISTVAGDGKQGPSGDGGHALSAQLRFPRRVSVDDAGRLYVSDHLRVRAVDEHGVITTIAGNGQYFYGGDGGPATSAQFNEVVSIAVGGGCNLYVAVGAIVFDPLQHRVRRVACDGTITTIAGTGAAGFSGDGGPAAAAQIDEPAGMVEDDAGNVFFSDSRNHRVRMIDVHGRISTVAGTGSQGFGGDGGPATQAKLSLPAGLALDQLGRLYFADPGNYRIRRIDLDGTITTVAGAGIYGYGGDDGPATSARIGFVNNIALDRAGNLFIADRNNNAVRRVDPEGTITTVAGVPGVPGGYDADGLPATASRLRWPEGVAVDADGRVYVADALNNRVRRIEADGRLVTVVGTGEKSFGGDGGPPAEAHLNHPVSLAFDAAGNLYIAEFANRRVRVVRPPF